MNNSKFPSPLLKISLQWGCIIGFTYLCLRFLGHSVPSSTTFLSLPIFVTFILGFYLSFKQFRTHNGNILSVLQGMKLSWLMGIVIGLINSPYITYIFATDSSIKIEYMREYENVLRNILQVKGQQFELMMSQADLLYTPTFMFFGDFIGTLFQVTILGLIVSLFMYRKQPPFKIA